MSKIFYIVLYIFSLSLYATEKNYQLRVPIEFSTIDGTSTFRITASAKQPVYVKVLKKHKYRLEVALADKYGRPYRKKSVLINKQDFIDKINESTAILVDNSLRKLQNIQPQTSYCIDCLDEPEKRSKTSIKRSIVSNNLCEISSQGEMWKAHCNELLSGKKVPKDAMKYALTVLNKNATSFQSNKCYDYGNKKHKSKASLYGKSKKQFENGYMKHGIKNKCQMIINDLGKRMKGNPCRTKTYLIDICKNKVKTVYSFVGYGTCKKWKYKKKRGDYYIYSNKSNMGTTTLGAFVSGPLFGYKSEKSYSHLDASYKGVVDYLKKHKVNKIPAASLFGLNTTNSHSARDLKYIHVSPYTSAGCNSIPKENYQDVLTLINNGPSLVVNYLKGKMEDIEKCSQ